MKSSNEKVNSFLEDIQATFPERFEIVESIRVLFLEDTEKNAIDIEEDIKYGGIIFNIEKQLIGGIFLYKNHLSIEFSFGVDFLDPEGLLEGKGKLRRHLKITNKEDFLAKKATFYIAQAIRDLSTTQVTSKNG